MFLANGLKSLANDDALLNHFAYLFIRDSPTIYKKDIEKFSKIKGELYKSKWITSNKLEDNEIFLKNTNFFEAIQSSNYNNVRFKPSKSFDDKNSWLVEFRPFDIPKTSREKNYLIFFVTLFQRIFTDQKIFTNFYIPISAVDQNILRSVKREAVFKEKFFFRRHFYGETARDDAYIPKKRLKRDIQSKRDLFIKNELIELTLEELLIGGENHQGFRGLIQLFVKLNADSLENESKKKNENIVEKIWESFDFFLKRSQGKLLTSASLIRKFVRSHSEYQFDSVVEGKVTDDLIEFLFKVQTDNYHVDLFGLLFFIKNLKKSKKVGCKMFNLKKIN